MEFASPSALQSPLSSELRLRYFSGAAAMATPRSGFMPWGSPPGRLHEWWQPMAGAGASGWTPLAAARATPPFLRDRLAGDDTDDGQSAAARWGAASSASTQVLQSGSDLERVLLFGYADPLPDGGDKADEAVERCASAALALVRSAPQSPLAPQELNTQPRGALAKVTGKKVKVSAAMQLTPARAAVVAPAAQATARPSPARPDAHLVRTGKRSKPAAPLPAAPAPARSGKRKLVEPSAAPLPAVPGTTAMAAGVSEAQQAAPSNSGRRSVPGVCSWTQEEDGALLRLTQVYGERSWAEVAAALGCGRSGKQVRERYMYIKPGQNTGPWTEEEESELMGHHERLGNRWAEIARLMHRPDNMVKNRYYSRQKAALKKAAAMLALQVPREMKGAEKGKEERLQRQRCSR